MTRQPLTGAQVALLTVLGTVALWTGLVLWMGFGWAVLMMFLLALLFVLVVCGNGAP